MKELVQVQAGFANRMNGVMSNLDSTILWPEDGSCMANWNDLFLTPHDVIGTHTGIDEVKIRHAGCMFTGDFEMASNWLLTLKPSEEVKARMPDLSKIKTGYHIRALYPHYPIGQKIQIPHDAFLATDSSMVRQWNSNSIMTESVPTTRLDGDVRTREHVLCAVADWFVLLHCETVFSYGVPFISFALKHSTFLDARRILGRKVIDC